MSETDYVVFVAPLLKGAFFVSVTPIGGGGSFPYAVLSSTAALRKFVMKEMQLEDCVVEEIMQFALRREPYRYIGLLREQAQEAIRLKHMKRQCTLMP
jgi:hypothetical protein